MENISIWEMILRLGISVLLGGLIGLEREAHDRPAGMRTHILVSIGSTLFTLASFEIAYDTAGQIFDPGRVAAQIVTGIGFLGAGTIIRTGTVVRGLTTAASIWTVAAIGMAVAIGGTMLVVAIAASLLVLGTLVGVRWLEKFLMIKRDELTLVVALRGEPHALAGILDIIREKGGLPRLAGSEDTGEGTALVRIAIGKGRNFDEESLDKALATSEDVISYNWE